MTIVIYTRDDNTAQIIKNNSINSHNNSFRYSDYYGEKQEIAICNIEYIKAHRRYSSLIFDGNEITISKNLGVLEHEFKNTTLIRVHRSYIINSTFVVNITEKKITLSSGKKIPVGPKYLDNLYGKFPDAFLACGKRGPCKKFHLLQ
ncbi:LytTR family DNA-binding domain-containing protein [Lachnobacterium bovis]|uniref:LytTr DNA-binding domain-containing protein n=1 Tax=Lachnobacterium bovis TaxID=140626 RepID=A0A1H9U4G4_9FIRM|nr:LytTR family DNA-binding domain-containing protein [Lachnobacterium bovis]SES04054.1 LytTr DNA-binding domain-containing protein [Lachnobacterium bovis]